MSEPVQNIRPITPGSESQAPAAQSPSSESTVAFQALLEKLEESAADLAREEAGIASAEQLASAVERARDSFGEALELGRDLLENLHQAQLQQDLNSESESSL